MEAVGKWVQAGIEDHLVIAGAVGEGFAIEFSGFMKVWRAIPDLDDIIKNPLTAPVPPSSDPSTLVALVSALAFKATKANFANIISYLQRCPKEYEFLAVRDATARDATLNETGAYTQWAISNQALFA